MNKAERIEVWCEGEKIATITEYTLTVDDYDSEGWVEAMQSSFTIPIETIFIDETWFAAYMGRMYTNMFTN